MADCVFCSIVADDSPAHRVYEDESTLAFLDIEPAARGHTLVIPKAHCEGITDLQEELAGELFQTVQRVATVLESAYDPDGISIVQANGRAAGQEILHAHVHVIARYEDDDVTVRWEPRERDQASQQETADALRAASDSLSE